MKNPACMETWHEGHLSREGVHHFSYGKKDKMKDKMTKCQSLSECSQVDPLILDTPLQGLWQQNPWINSETAHKHFAAVLDSRLKIFAQKIISISLLPLPCNKVLHCHLLAFHSPHAQSSEWRYTATCPGSYPWLSKNHCCDGSSMAPLSSLQP